MHTVQELEEDGRKAATLAAGVQVAPLAELVAEREPFFLQKDLKTLKSPVERIAQQLHQGHDLPRGREKVRRKRWLRKNPYMKTNTLQCKSMLFTSQITLGLVDNLLYPRSQSCSSGNIRK